MSAWTTPVIATSVFATRRKSAACGERQRLCPVIVVVACGAAQPRWRNGLQRRRWLLLTEQVRGDRRCFLMTLRRPPLVSPISPF